MTSLDCLVYLFYSLVALLWIVFAAHSAAVTYVGLFRPILRTCRKLCLWTLRGFPFVSGFLAAWLLPSPCHKCLGLVVFLATFRRLYRGPLRNLCGVLRPASEQCKPHTLTPALWTWTVLGNITYHVLQRLDHQAAGPGPSTATPLKLCQVPEPCSLSILCSSFAAGVRITVSALLPRCKVTVRKSQATRSTAQSASLGQQLRYQKRATRQSNIKYAKAAQKLCAALKLVQQLQASQQQLVDRSAGCQQESARLKRILTRTARSGRHARARCAVLLQSVHESSALQTRCHDLEGMVTHLSAALTAANKKAAQDGTCLGLANSDIRALETLTQDLQQSSHQQTSQRQHLQQQLSHSEAGNRKLVNANQNLKRGLAAAKLDTARFRQEVAQAHAAAQAAETANSRLQGEATSAQGKAANLAQQLSQTDKAAAEAQAANGRLQSQLAASLKGTAALRDQLAQYHPIKLQVIIHVAAGITNPSAQAASLATEKKSDSPKLAQKSPAAALVVDSIKAIRPSPALAAGNNIAADTRTETALSAVKKHSTAAATPQAASGTAAGAAAHVPACEGSRQTGPAAGTHKHATSPADACRDVVNAAAQTTAPAQPGNTTPAQAPASIAAPAQPQQACQIIAALQDKLALPEQQVADVTGSAAEELVGLRTRYRVHRYDEPCQLGQALGKGVNGEVHALSAYILPHAVVKTSRTAKSIEHEAEVLSDIHHPNVVAGYGTLLGPVLEDRTRRLYLSMERLHHSLLDRRRQGRLTVKELFMGLSQAAAGLHAVHVKGIVHQDVRLDNILCNEDDTVWKIGDFGSSARNRVDGKPNIIAAQECQRSCGGESPELAQALLKDGHYIPRVAQDVWAFGLCMLEAVGGSRPVEHDALLQSLDYVAERQKGNRLPAYLQYLADTSSAPTPYSEQVTFPVAGRGIFLAPDEQAPFVTLQLLIKKCLSAKPEARCKMNDVARWLHITALQAGWL